MSRGNPEKAIAALIPSPLEAVPGVVVRPMTLGMWAALERIKSPLVTGDVPKDTLELVPSLYLMTHDPREIFRPDFLDAAMKWADTMPVDVVAAIDKAARRQIDAAVDVIPEDDGKTSKKKNDGWITTLVDWAAETYGWGFEQILWDVPLSAICLLRRQAGVRAGKVFPLQVIEEIDHGNEKADSRD